MLGNAFTHGYMSEIIIHHWWGRWSVYFYRNILFVCSIAHSHVRMASCKNAASMYLIHIIGGRVGGGGTSIGGRGETIRFGFNAVHKSRPYHLLTQEETKTIFLWTLYMYTCWKEQQTFYGRGLNGAGILRNERGCFEKKTRTKYTYTRTHTHTHTTERFSAPVTIPEPIRHLPSLLKNSSPEKRQEQWFHTSV